MEVKRLETLASETLKTINNLNHSFMKNRFTSKSNDILDSMIF